MGAKRRIQWGILWATIGVVAGLGFGRLVFDDDDGPAEPGPAHTVETEVDVIVFLTRDVTDTQRTALEDALQADSRLAAFEYVGPAESVEEFRQIFADNQAMIDRAASNPDLVPASYRLILTAEARDEPNTVESTYAGSDGVLRIATVPDCDESEPDADAEPPVRCRRD